MRQQLGPIASTCVTVLGCIALATTACDAPDVASDTPLDVLELGPAHYSQDDEELIIRHFFGDRREGFFVDVGAYHWKVGSTTLYLENRLGWSGIAVDALARFEPGYRENRPNTRFFAYIVTDRSGEDMTIYVRDALTSLDPEHSNQFEAVLEKPVPEQVETITLDDLLEREGIESIDFLSMDIEGHEPTALAGFDIERFRPELVCIEVVEATREAINAYFTRHGYERIDGYRSYDLVNWYFRPKPGWR